MIRPGAGRNPVATSSALIRHSIAWPRSRTSSCRSESGSPGRDQHLLAHEVDPGHLLGDGVLDLDAGVHLHEVVVAVRGEQALDRPGGAVAGGARGIDRDPADPLAQRLVDRGRGRLLDELLVAPLDRAVALAEVDHVAVRVGEHLHLDVPRILEVALDVDAAVGEVLLALALGRLEGTLRLVRRARRASCPCRRRPPPP